MKKQRVYIDTSVIGGCFDDEFYEWSNGLINDFKKNLFIPVVSDIVAAEISDAPNFIKEKYKEIIESKTEIISLSTEAIELAKTFQARKIISEKFFDDGLHIAIATIAEVDILVSWNFKHIVHFDKIRMFQSVSLEMGYKPISIYSPREVTFYGIKD